MAPGWSPCACITLGLCVTRILSLLPSSLHGAGAGGGRTRRRLKEQSPIYSSTIFEPMKRQSPLLRGGHSLDQAPSFPAGLDTQSRKPSEEDSCPSRGQRVCTPDTPAHAPARACRRLGVGSLEAAGKNPAVKRNSRSLLLSVLVTGTWSV